MDINKKIEQKFTKRYIDELTLLNARALPVIPNAIMSAFYSLIRYPIKKYILITLTGVFICTTIIITIGWQVCDILYIIYAEFISQIKIFILIIGTALIIFLFLRWQKKIKKIIYKKVIINKY